MNHGTGPSPEARWEWISEAMRAFAEQTGELDRLVFAVARSFGSAVNAACVVRLRSGDGRFLNPSALWCPDPAFESALRRTVAAAPIRVDAGKTAKWARESGSPIRLERTFLADLGVELRSEQTSIASMIEGCPGFVVPLRNRNREFGLAYVLRSLDADPFTAEHEALLEDLVGPAVVALDNALRIRTLRDENAQFRRQASGSNADEAQRARRDAIVTLVGGLAHDYDNLISAVRMCTNLLWEHTPDGDPLHTDLEEVRRACDRAAELTPRLAVLSQRRVLEPELLDPIEVIQSVRPGLDELADGGARLHVDLAASSSDRVIADRAQLAQALVDLVATVCRIASHSGFIQVRAAARTVDADNLFGVGPGRYFVFSVDYDDTGSSPGAVARMVRPVPSRWSEPNPGLALAAVGAFAQQSGGVVNTAYRAPLPAVSQSRGWMTVSLFLPVVLDGAEEEPLGGAHRLAPEGVETILLALPHVAQRAELRFTLRRHGYQVLDAYTPQHALDVARAFPDTIHLILVDSQSVELADRLGVARPDTVIEPVREPSIEPPMKPAIGHGDSRASEGGIDAAADDASLLSRVRAVITSSLRRTAPEQG